jgi:tetratricopeptide (TPR) repeat protein
MADELGANDQPLGVAAQITEARWPDLPLIVSAPENEIKRSHRKEVIELSIAVLVLIWTGIIPAIILYHEHQANERQTQSFERQTKAMETKTLLDIQLSQPQLSISRAQLAASLLPSMAKGTPNERESALFILSSAAPDLAGAISSTLEKNVALPQGKQLAADISQLSIQTRNGQEFTQHLVQARVMQRFGDFAQADREYIRAVGVKPPRLKADTARLDQAKALYESDKWEEAARLFDEAFGDTTSQ